MGNTLLTILQATVIHLYPLLLLFVFFSILLFFVSIDCNFATRIKKKSLRLHIDLQYVLTSCIILLAITIIYWIIDTQVVSLPIPIQPYIFFVLILTLLFGYRIGIIAAILSTICIVYFLYEPRYTLNPLLHSEDIILTVISLGVSIGIGGTLRNYQQKLVLESEQLKKLIKARDQFASVAAHDLRTPVTVIKLYLQSIIHDKKQKTAKEVKESLTSIDRETDKLINLVNVLFDFSRLESGKFELVKKKFDLVPLCHSALETAGKVYPTHTFILKNSIRRLPIFGDVLSIERILINILTNAAKYSPAGTTVTLSLTTSKHDVTISIQDQGKGIPAAQHKRLFDPFYQSSKSKSGIGLGLYIAKSLVELHKGTIWVESKRSKGATFYIRLPRSLHA